MSENACKWEHVETCTAHCSHLGQSYKETTKIALPKLIGVLIEWATISYIV